MRSGGPSERSPALVVFDWDGTLIDSIGAIVDCTYAMLEELGLPRLDEERIRAFIGGGLEESVVALAPDGDAAMVRQVVDTYRRLWFGGFHQRSTLIDGALAVIDELEARGALLAIATAKSRRGLIADLERTGLDGRFHASRTADETAAKPSPAMLLEILDELGVRAERALMVGDALHDVGMAKNAGVEVVAVTSGSQTREALVNAGPTACLGSVAELAEWLGSRA